MSSPADIARLNVLIELFSECADAPDLETLLRVAIGRLRWVFDFDRCTIALVHGNRRAHWLGTHAADAVSCIEPVQLLAHEAGLLDTVLETGASAALQPGTFCVPLQAAGRTLGALCFSRVAGAYVYRDMRLGHHAGQYLGSLVSRIQLAEEARLLGEAKDDLLALLSHELRNPLAPIITAVHLLKERSTGESDKELDIIDRQARHVVRLLDDLLDVTRMTRGKMVLQRAPVELARVVSLAVEMVSPLLEQRRHSLVVDVPPGLVLDADENRLAQVVSNLLSNAALYTELAGHIAISARRDGRMVVIDVSDDGVGIAAANLSSIFDLFVQGPNRASGGAGLGLGLVVVKQLTELHGGAVSVVSEGDGRGTKFSLRLPVMDADFVVPLPSVSDRGVLLADVPHKVLLVDDNEDALELLSSLVRIAGHEVVTAHDGPAALAALDRFQPSVAVFDIGMPVMDGYELAARVQAHYVGALVPYLVALTGYSQAADRQRSLRAGFVEHLVKPVDLAELLRIIARAPVFPAAA